MRLPQQERSTATRSRVLDAAVECLLELGYANTTTALVADRAGVSRGAMQYHFRTKSELVAAALADLVERMGDEFRRAAMRLPAEGGEDRCAAAIDLLWSAQTDPLTISWLELNAAALTDPELKELVRGLRPVLSRTVRDAGFELFGGDADDGAMGLFIELNLAVLSGLMTARITGIAGRRRTRREAQLLEAWKDVAPLLLARMRSLDGSRDAPAGHAPL
jgi:AcrR family transcriptional regulator